MRKGSFFGRIIFILCMMILSCMIILMMKQINKTAQPVVETDIARENIEEIKENTEWKNINVENNEVESDKVENNQIENNEVKNTKVENQVVEEVKQNQVIENQVKNEIQENQVVVAPILGIEENKTTTQLTPSKREEYFYNQLSDEAKIIYEAIVENKENMKTGTYEIKLENVFQSLLEENGEQALKQAYQDAWDAINCDRVDMFYIDNSKVYLYITTTQRGSEITYTVSLKPTEGGNYYAQGFSSKASVNTALQQLTNIKQNIIAQLSGNTYQKITQVNDYLVENLSYDESTSRINTRNIYGAFIEKSVVCEGYAKALKYILDELKIPCILVSGTAANSEGQTELHLWNYVQISGNWYAVDCTWNDPIVQGGGKQTEEMKHAYLCKGSETIKKTHKTNGSISEQGKIFSYPTLTTKDYQ